MAAVHANLGSVGPWPGLNVYKYCALFRAGSQNSALNLFMVLTDSRKRNWEKGLQKHRKEPRHIFSSFNQNLARGNLSLFMIIIQVFFVHLFSNCCLSI